MAAVLAVDGETLVIDQGLKQGLRPADRGAVYYQLTVAGSQRRIDLGQVEVTGAAIDTSVTTLSPKSKVQPGYLIEFQIAPERLSPARIVAAIRENLGEAAAAEVAREYLEELEGLGAAPETASEPPEAASRSAGPPQPATEPDEAASSDTVEGGEAQSRPVIDSEAPSTPMLRIPAGVYAIGLDKKDARFHNQTPRFDKELAAFWIDPTPTGATGLDFADAEGHCAARGGRLPTEFEWEVAARLSEFERDNGLEWTSSWYLPYPGNRRSEPEYGEQFRVLRGARQDDRFQVAIRHYFESTSSSREVGFRCALTASSAD